MIYALFFLAGALCTLAALWFLLRFVLNWIEADDTAFAQRMGEVTR